MTTPRDDQAMPWRDPDLDALLRSTPGSAPADFADRVLQRLAQQPAGARPHGAHHQPVQPAGRWRALAERAALLAAAALGMGQVLAFIFGLWAATATA